MSHNSNNSENTNKRIYVSESEDTECFSRFRNIKKLRANNFDPIMEERLKKQISSDICGCYEHILSQCTNNNNGRQGFLQNPYLNDYLTHNARTIRVIKFSTTISNYKKMGKEIKFIGKNAKCFIDTES